jgi:hypothetical protein
MSRVKTIKKQEIHFIPSYFYVRAAIVVIVVVVVVVVVE